MIGQVIVTGSEVSAPAVVVEPNTRRADAAGEHGRH
jgi:hypothetical protein